MAPSNMTLPSQCLTSGNNIRQRSPGKRGVYADTSSLGLAGFGFLGATSVPIQTETLAQLEWSSPVRPLLPCTGS